MYKMVHACVRMNYNHCGNFALSPAQHAEDVSLDDGRVREEVNRLCINCDCIADSCFVKELRLVGWWLLVRSEGVSRCGAASSMIREFS